MLLTLGLLLLLTPFPSFQTIYEKRVARGSNVTKNHTVFIHARPKTTADPTKQAIHPTLKPNMVNVTVLSTPASNQKPSTVNATAPPKTKPGPVMIQTTPSAALKVTTASSSILKKDKQVSSNLTHQVKSVSNRKIKANQDKPAPTAAVNVQSTKPPLVTKTKTHKDKPQQSANHTASVKSLATNDGKFAKDKTASTKGQNVQSTSISSSPASGTKTTKNKYAGSVNQTVVPNTPPTNDVESKDEPASTKVQTVLSTPEKPTSVGVEKDKLLNSVNASVIKAPNNTDGAKPPPSQPIKVVISDGCELNNAKEQEIKLKPGAPLVMTHKISLQPGACTGGCEAEMRALKGRVARLEKEMSSLKDKCPCSENCPFDCGGNGECDRGKCICQQGFTGPDCRTAKESPKITVETTMHRINTEKENMPEIITRVQHTTIHNEERKTGTETKNTSEKEVRKGKTAILVTKNVNQKSVQLKDEPQSNITQSHVKKLNGTDKVVTIPPKITRINSTRTGKESMEQSTLSGPKKTKMVKPDTEKGKVPLKSKRVENATTSETTDDSKFKNKTTLQDNQMKPKKSGGLGSVRAVNISSHSFTVTWLAPQGMFKNFTLIRKEPQTAADKKAIEGFEEETSVNNKIPTAKNTTKVAKGTTRTTVSPASGKTESKRISVVVPGNVYSMEFSNLQANTRYVLHVYGTTADRRSKIHRISATTGPEPPTGMVFSNVTESALTVSWIKPKTSFTGYRVTYMNIVTGESRSVNVKSQQSHVVLSELSAGSSYIISVVTTQGRSQSNELTSVITTVPSPPTHLQVVNVTDTKAVIQWTPSPGKVDRFILSYESSKTPNVTVTVMVSGNSVEHQLRGLQRGSQYSVKVLSQKDSLQSMSTLTMFTTANVVKASEVGPRTAVIAWKTPIVYQSYKVIYRVAGEEAKEMVLEPTATECKLTGLLPMSQYTVVVQGEKNGQYTSVVTSEFVTGKLRFPFPTECSQELLNGALQSGEVEIYPEGKEGQVVKVYCDMETDGGGWTVFQRRMNGKTDFQRTWNEYKSGFGNLSEEFWLGNELLHNLTSLGPVGLRVDMRAGDDTAYAHYANFSVSSEEKHFVLSVSGYTGTAGDSMRYHNGRPFSARDKDPAPLGIHCAKAYMGGWWYKNCYKANFNGLYGINNNNQGVVWIDWKGKDFSIPFTEMKFRPSRFSPTTYG